MDMLAAYVLRHDDQVKYVDRSPNVNRSVPDEELYYFGIQQCNNFDLALLWE